MGLTRDRESRQQTPAATVLIMHAPKFKILTIRTEVGVAGSLPAACCCLLPLVACTVLGASLCCWTLLAADSILTGASTYGHT
jgi:hypothetical protein